MTISDTDRQKAETNEASSATETPGSSTRPKSATTIPKAPGPFDLDDDRYANIPCTD